MPTAPVSLKINVDTEIPCPLPFDSPILTEWTARCARAVERFAIGTELRHLRSGAPAIVTAIHTDLSDLEPVFAIEYTGSAIKGFAATYHLDEIGDHFTPASMYVGLLQPRSRRQGR